MINPMKEKLLSGLFYIKWRLGAGQSSEMTFVLRSEGANIQKDGGHFKRMNSKKGKGPELRSGVREE